MNHAMRQIFSVAALVFALIGTVPVAAQAVSSVTEVPALSVIVYVIPLVAVSF